jgi:hypothetical protein
VLERKTLRLGVILGGLKGRACLGCVCVFGLCFVFEFLKVGPFKGGLPLFMLSSYKRAMFFCFMFLVCTSSLCTKKELPVLGIMRMAGSREPNP